MIHLITLRVISRAVNTEGMNNTNSENISISSWKNTNISEVQFESEYCAPFFITRQRFKNENNNK